MTTMTVTKKIGKNSYQFQIEGANLFEMVIESKKLSFPDIDKCGICGGNDLRLDAYITKEKKYKYTVIRCKCGAKVNFGLTTEGDTYFLKRNEDGSYAWEAPQAKDGEAEHEPETKHEESIETKVTNFKIQPAARRKRLLEEAVKECGYKRANPNVGLETYSLQKQGDFYEQLLKLIAKQKGEKK